MVDYALIGRRIKYYRKKCEKTQAKLAEELNISTPFMSQIERGSTHISLDRLFSIAKLIDTSPQTLISTADNEASDYLASDIAATINDWSNNEIEWLVNSIHLYNQLRRNSSF